MASPQKISTRDNGTYNFTILLNDTGVISISEMGYEPLRESVIANQSSLTKNFFLVPKSTFIESVIDSKRNEPFLLKNVLFKLTTAVLLPESFPELSRLANLMHTNPSMKIRLEGHTDKIGDANKNLTLSEDRVLEVKHYLIQKGISENRIITKGYGDTKTICNPPCESNRRVEFVITE